MISCVNIVSLCHEPLVPQVAQDMAAQILLAGRVYTRICY